MTKYTFVDFDVNDEEECLEAVKKDGMKLMFVKHQTPAICLEAVKQNGRALRRVDDQTFDICCEAVRKDPDAFEYIRNKEMKERVVKKLLDLK
jgi:hypothetical protein